MTDSDELVERVARAIDDADVGYSIQLTRLVDGVSTYTATCNGETREFEDHPDASEWVSAFRLRSKAQAALAATPLAQMRDALEEIINPIAAMQARLKEGEILDGNMAHMLAKDPEYLRSIARAALTGEAP